MSSDIAPAGPQEISHSFTDIEIKQQGKTALKVPLLRYTSLADYVAKYSEVGVLTLVSLAHEAEMRKIIRAQIKKGKTESGDFLAPQLVYEAIKPPKVKKVAKPKVSKNAMAQILAKIASGELTLESMGIAAEESSA